MLLRLNNIKKYYAARKGGWQRAKDYIRAVDHVDLTMEQGVNLGLVGESGCGKTTLGRIILKLIRPDLGQIFFEEKDITDFSRRQMRPIRKDIQMVFQDPFSSLDPRFTIRNILAEAMLFDQKINKLEKEKKMEELLVTVNLPEDILERFPHEFSGGERQRLAIARALCMNPKLLVLDEAVSSLDVLVQEQIVHLLHDLQKKFEMTYLFISHNMRIVKKISSKIAVMYKGKIVEVASADEIFENPYHPYTKELLSAAMEYRVIQRTVPIEINDTVRLQDKGGGHFVLE